MSQAQKSNALDFFIHPLPLAAVLLMAINDHWLKYQYPGLITGKISDFCGVFYLPIFLLALAVSTQLVFSRWRSCKILTTKNLLIAIVITDLLMISVKLVPVIADGIELFFQHYLFSIQIISDPTDLIALLMNPLTFLYMKSHLQGLKSA